MSIEKPANERLNLYNRFKDSLRSGDESTFYDADDLIVIIDQAVDLQDDYVQLEAIMRGYRYFPDNSELAARRAFFYFDMNLAEGVENTSKQLSPDSPIALILNIRKIENPQFEHDKIISLLNQVVSYPDKLEDEEVIQLIDAASSAGCFQWIKENEKLLRKKTDYLPTLLYEIFIVSDINHDREYSIKLLEELTELQPFNIDFWNALAQTQADESDIMFSNPDIAGALNSLDFALAIDNFNADALALKASLLIKLHNAEEAEKLLRPLINPISEGSKNLNSVVARMYVCSLIEKCDYDNAAIFVREFARKFPEDDDFVDIALSLPYDVDIQSVLKLHFNPQSDIDIEKYTYRAEKSYRRGQLHSALKVLEFLYNENCLTEKGYRLLFSGYYAVERYQTCVDLYKTLEETKPDFLLSEMIIAYLMSLMYIGKKSDIKKAHKQVLKRLPMNMQNTWTLATTAESIGMNNFMTAVKSLLDEPGSVNPDDINIFIYPYSNEI